MDQEATAVVPDQVPPAHGRPPRAWTRAACALVVVWAVSAGASLVHLAVLVAAVWVVASLILVPIGKTLGDRIVAYLLLCAAPAVLIAWFTPFAPWLVSPAALTALLGTMGALAWGLGWTRRPVARVQDWVAVGMGMLTAGVFWIPFMTGGFVRAVGVLSAGFDEPSHYFMWVRVWANHGYLLFNTLRVPDYWGWRVYPQGAHAILADIGTVVTSDGRPPALVDRSVTLFAVLVCLQAGALALVTAWSVDRLARTRANAVRWRVITCQAVAALLVAVGPGSVVSVQSMSFAAGLVVIIPALALAATAADAPRRNGILVGASLIAAAAIYPVCAVMAIALWPLYLVTSRRFWTADRRHCWYAVVWTIALALLCAPMFLLLVFRKVDHNWDTWGYFQVLNKGVYAGIAILLAIIIVIARGRIPKAIEYAAWAAAAVSVALLAEGIHQFLTSGQPTYYTVKTMYLGWALSVIVVGASLASLQASQHLRGLPARKLAIRLVSWLAASVLVAGSLFTGLLLAGLGEGDPIKGPLAAVSKEAWIISGRDNFQSYGASAVAVAQYASQHDGVTVVAPCSGGGAIILIRWGMFLKGGMTESELLTHSAACSSTQEAPLGTLPAYLHDHPEVTVNALTTDQATYEYALRIKKEMKLDNLRVVPPGGAKVSATGSG